MGLTEVGPADLVEAAVLGLVVVTGHGDITPTSSVRNGVESIVHHAGPMLSASVRIGVRRANSGRCSGTAVPARGSGIDS
ncbi:hypothetical protein [Candidatus Frankia alpina]|uniref:Uncharacterized protein n=1 Tax=Candidatus Frankia alpina TaxID=2699483 RepID=A0A4S5ENM6_9ACTN|nr:hypothetical protein [Candidatus Frankia alpina]THJ73874.1 hypothetical protein E7Y31_14110 [Candidatus Frankia alpina]